MSAEPISMQEWLQNASPNCPLRLIRDEARTLHEQAVEFFTDLYFEETNERHQYAGDEH